MYITGKLESLKTEDGKTKIIVSMDGEDKASWIKRKEILNVGLWLDDGRTISTDQRKKIYASFRDFSIYTGYTPEEAKQILKNIYVERTGREYFSLSDCSMDTARHFINIIIDVCLENGIILSDSLYDRVEDIEYMLRSCLRNKKCAVCGRTGEVHHWDAIGMGNDRKHFDDSSNRKICLCRKHHIQAHAYGRKRFAAMYHVYGIYYVESSI